MAVRFSIVTVCLNDLEGLRLTLASVDAQECRDFEWLVMDGGSTDGTPAFLESQAASGVSFQSSPDRGLYDAMNKGLESASGDYVVFMNSGDGFAGSDTLARISAELSGGGIDLLYGDAVEIDEVDEYYKRATGHRLVWYSMFTHHQSIYYRREFVGSSRYRLDFRLAADWAFTAEILKKGAVVRYLPEALCRFRRGGLSQDEKHRRANNDEHRRIHSEVLLTPRLLAAFLIGLKRAVNELRARYPRLYDRIRMSGRS